MGKGLKIIEVDKLAELLDLSARRVQQLAADDVMVKAGRGRYDLFRSVQGYVKYLNALIPNKLDGGIDRAARADAENSRAHYLREKAALTELQRKEKEGLMVNKEKERRAAYSLARGLRNTIMNIPARVSVRFAAVDDADQIYRELEKELNESLALIADMAEQGDAAVDAERLKLCGGEDCAHWVGI